VYYGFSGSGVVATGYDEIEPIIFLSATKLMHDDEWRQHQRFNMALAYVVS